MDLAARRRAWRAGLIAEAATAGLLRLKGFRPIGRRVRTPVGEIDIVARRGRLIVFVEVKLRKDGDHCALTARNRARIVAAAKWWLAANARYAGYTMRFDVVFWRGIALPSHIPAAFDAEP